MSPSQDFIIFLWPFQSSLNVLTSFRIQVHILYLAAPNSLFLPGLPASLPEPTPMALWYSLSSYKACFKFTFTKKPFQKFLPHPTNSDFNQLPWAAAQSSDTELGRTVFLTLSLFMIILCLILGCPPTPAPLKGSSLCSELPQSSALSTASAINALLICGSGTHRNKLIHLITSSTHNQAHHLIPDTNPYVRNEPKWLEFLLSFLVWVWQRYANRVVMSHHFLIFFNSTWVFFLCYRDIGL